MTRFQGATPYYLLYCALTEDRDTSFLKTVLWMIVFFVVFSVGILTWGAILAARPEPPPEPMPVKWYLCEQPREWYYGAGCDDPHKRGPAPRVP